jgi:hypothetical protein
VVGEGGAGLDVVWWIGEVMDLGMSCGKGGGYGTVVGVGVGGCEAGIGRWWGVSVLVAGEGGVRGGIGVKGGAVVMCGMNWCCVRVRVRMVVVVSRD